MAKDTKDKGGKKKKVDGMEVVFNTEALLSALKLASLAAAKSSPKYILEHVLIRAAMDIVNIRATDLEVGLDIQVVQSETKAEGYAALPAKEFTEAVSRCEDETIILRRAEKCVQLVTSNGRYEFNLIDVKEFPAIQFGFDVGEGCELKLADLQAVVGKVLHAAAKEATRYALNGVLWESAPAGLNLVATDGRRLTKTVLKTKVQLPDGRPVVSKKTMELLCKIEAAGSAEVRIEISDSNIFFATDTVYLCGLILDGKYPAYKDVIPVGCEHSISLDAAAVAKQVRRAKIFESVDENVRNVIISSENGELLFDAENVGVGKAEMRLAVDTEGNTDDSDCDHRCPVGAFEIAVRSKYLLDALKTMDKFRLEVNDSDRPLVLADDDTVHVIMPVNV